jgi:hypothetical protein
LFVVFRNVSVETPFAVFANSGANETNVSGARPAVRRVRFKPGQAEKTSALDASTLSVHYNPEITTNNAPRRKKLLFFHIFLKTLRSC